MATDTNITGLVVNQLTETQLANTTIQPNQIWVTEDEDADDTKANVNLSNVTVPDVVVGQTTTGSADRVIEQYISSDGKTWYRKWASGWKECGLNNTYGSSWGPHTFLFPISFTNVDSVNIQMSQKMPSGSASTNVSTQAACITNKTSTSVQYWGDSGWIRDIYVCGY